LRRTLASLLLLDYPVEKWELLVVDNAPDDNTTARVVADFPRCKYVVESRPGLNWARNCAVLEASGEIIAYTDDDVEVDSQWLRSLAHHFVNPAVMCVTGLVVPAQRETPAQNLFEEYGGFGRGFETRYFTMGVRKYWRYWPLGAGIFGTGCNMAFRRSLFDRIGLFDVALDVGTPSQGAGDHDLFYRTIRANYILVYEPRAIIWHYHRSDMTALQRQLRDFGRGVYAFWTKTFLTDSQMRWRTLTFAMSWYLQWFGGRLLHGHPGGRFPRGLVLIEAIGALQGPWAYILAHYQGRHMAHKRHSLRTTVPDTDREMRPSSFEALDVKRDI
jgi:glycosyltransferase involved in cell wall biosynthesis